MSDEESQMSTARRLAAVIVAAVRQAVAMYSTTRALHSK